MKRLIPALALLALLAGATALWAELRYTEVGAVSTSQTFTINASNLSVCNDDTTNEVYIRIFVEGETPAVATTSNARIKANEGCWGFRKDLNISAVSIICASGETATVRLFYW